MLTQARARLGAAGGRMAYVLSDLSTPGWATELGGPFDAVVSSIAIHNMADPGRIRALYGEIASLLRSGGWFLNVDLIPAPAALADLYGPPGHPLRRVGTGPDAGQGRRGAGEHRRWTLALRRPPPRRSPPPRAARATER